MVSHHLNPRVRVSVYALQGHSHARIVPGARTRRTLEPLQPLHARRALQERTRPLLQPLHARHAPPASTLQHQVCLPGVGLAVSMLCFFRTHTL